jgi:hypothetical protein
MDNDTSHQAQRVHCQVKPAPGDFFSRIVTVFLASFGRTDQPTLDDRPDRCRFLAILGTHTSIQGFMHIGTDASLPPTSENRGPKRPIDVPFDSLTPRIVLRISLRQIGYRPYRDCLGTSPRIPCHCASVKSLGYWPLIAIVPFSLIRETKKRSRSDFHAFRQFQDTLEKPKQRLTMSSSQVKQTVKPSHALTNPQKTQFGSWWRNCLYIRCGGTASTFGIGGIIDRRSKDATYFSI